MIKLDQETANKEVYEYYASDGKRQEHDKEFMELLGQVKEVNQGLFMDIESAEAALETRIAEISYSKGFHDGLQFILKAMAGQEVITF